MSVSCSSSAGFITDSSKTTAALEYLKLGFVDGDEKKAEIALRVALALSDDKTKEDAFVSAVCKRFRLLEDFDAGVMDSIFNFCVCNERVLALLDNVMISKTVEDHRQAIEHEHHLEFIFLFFNVLFSLVRRDAFDETIAKYSQMGDAWKIVDKHASAIARNWCSCFDLKAFKRPRQDDGHLSIGCERLNFEEFTFETWRDTLFDNTERWEFVGIIFAAVSHTSNTPLTTYRGSALQPVQDFFLHTMLDERQAERVMSLYNVVKVPGYLKQLGQLDSKYRALGDSYVAVQEKCWSLEEKYSLLDAKYRSLVQEHREQGAEVSRVREVIDDAKKRLDRKRLIIDVDGDEDQTGRSAKGGKVEE
ncbi:unnamed protein product [Ectocarpus sp. 12 AP-2014]